MRVVRIFLSCTFVRSSTGTPIFATELGCIYVHTKMASKTYFNHNTACAFSPLNLFVCTRVYTCGPLRCMTKWKISNISKFEVIQLLCLWLSLSHFQNITVLYTDSLSIKLCLRYTIYFDVVFFLVLLFLVFITQRYTAHHTYFILLPFALDSMQKFASTETKQQQQVIIRTRL